MGKVKFLCMGGVLMVTIILTTGAWKNQGKFGNDVLFRIKAEALADDESSKMKHCRCHDDGQCYDGYAISVRPLCAKGHNIVSCSEYSRNCPGYVK